MHSIRAFISSAAFTMIAWGLFAQPVFAANYPFCVSYQAQSADSGVGEDYWQTNLNTNIPAYGVRVRFQKGLSNYDIDTSPATGCGTLVTALAPPFNITVYAYVTDDDGNFARYFDGAWFDFSDYPGNTYSWYFPNQTLVAGVTKFINAGNYDIHATAMAAVALAHYRYDFGPLSNQTHLSDYDNADTTDCFKSSAHFCHPSSGECSFSDLANRAYIRYSTGANGCAAAGDAGARSKFIVLHELGHSEIMLHTERVEPLSTMDVTYAPPGTAPADCVVSTYSMGSWEYNAIGLREGFAHFFATRVFNDPDGGDDAFMGLFGAAWNVERAYAVDTVPGGRLVNYCNNGSNWIGNGTSTNIDWDRTFWDWHSPSAVPAYTIRDAYKKIIDDHYTGTLTLTKSNYYGRLKGAVGSVAANQTDKDAWVQDACWNGVDRQTGASNNCCYGGGACTY